MRATVKDHDPLIAAARDLRKRFEQLQLDATPANSWYADWTQFLAGVEDLADRVICLEKAESVFLSSIDALCDRVTRLETTQRRMLERLDFLNHMGRLLGHEDWNDLTIDDRTHVPGTLATEAQARVNGASGAGELGPPPGSSAPVT